MSTIVRNFSCCHARHILRRPQWCTARRTMTTPRSSRFLSSYKYKYVPEPSWLLEDLELTSKQPLIPKEELQRLSCLALINIESSNREILQHNLANMLHMVDQVSSYNYHPLLLEDDDDDEFRDDIYNGVRGVKMVPLQKNAEEDPLQQVDQEEAGTVWKSLLQPNTTQKGGGHEYFSIQTKQGE